MEHEEYYNRSGRSASRPPQWGTESDSSDLFTEIPLNQLRRTPNSGRPSESTYRPAAQEPSHRGASQRQSNYGSRSDAYESRPRSYESYRTQRPAQPVFTEISWDSLRTGRYDAPAQPPQRSAEPAWEDPFAQPEYRADDFQQYSQPAPRTAQPRYNTSTRTAPARRGYDRSAPQPPAYQPSGGYVPPRQPYTPPRRPPRRRGMHPIFYVIGLILAVLVILGIRAAIRGVSANRNTPKTTPVQYVPGSAVTPAPATATPDPNATPSPEPTPNVTPTPSPVPTPTPYGPKAKRSGDLIVPADWGPSVPERFHAQYDSYFDKSIMIGNSLVNGFFMWSGMTNIRYVYSTGAVVNNVIGVMDLGPIALNPGYYTDIYLMFGLNEVGNSVNVFTEGYKKLVDYIRGYQPTANIYCISVTPVTEKVDKDPNEVQTMERINNFNAALRMFCQDNGCWYLDIYSMLLDDHGYLSAEYAFEEDGKHFEKSGYVAWANYMKLHYVDAGLLTE